MDRLLSEFILLITAIIALIAVLFFSKSFISPQNWKKQNKIQANKQLLKQLLEGFGLELPSELKQGDISPVKSMKGGH
tara:strand:- start:344 stop:577 length:234 start_codon:yes stop_codon:yes gene_type:complete